MSPEVLQFISSSIFMSHSDFSFQCFSVGQLSSLVGALKIHEVLIQTDLVVKKENLPSDPFYKAVLIKQSRRKSAVNANDDLEYDDIVDSVDYD